MSVWDDIMRFFGFTTRTYLSKPKKIPGPPIYPPENAPPPPPYVPPPPPAPPPPPPSPPPSPPPPPPPSPPPAPPPSPPPSPPPPPPPPPPPGTPVISTVTASGQSKRQDQIVWLQVVDDGTGTSFKFDVQANGASLTGITIYDGSSEGTHDFPYTTSQASIAFKVPAALALQPYSITGTSSSGGSFATSVAADENFSYQSELFTPNIRSAPTLTRQTGSGTTAMQVLVGGPVYEGDNLRIKKFDGNDNLLVSSVVAIMDPALTGGFTLAIDGSFDPQPEPPLGATTSDNYFELSWETADYQISGPGDPISSGVTSPESTVFVTDPTGHQFWKLTFRNSGYATFYEIETALAVAGTNNATGRSYTYVPPSAYQAGPGNFSSPLLFDNSLVTGIGSLNINVSGLPASIIIDYGTPKDLHQLRLHGVKDFAGTTTTSVQFGPCQADGTLIGTPPVDVSELTWNASVDETKSWSW